MDRNNACNIFKVLKSKKYKCWCIAFEKEEIIDNFVNVKINN